MKVVALISGGKDSCYAMMRCLDYGHEVVALANLLPINDSIDELDSFMYQTVGHQVVMAYSQCMGLPLYRRRILGQSRVQGLKYSQTFGDEVEDLFVLLQEVQKHIPGIGGVSSGAIASDYQRMRVENVCSRLGLVSLAFLWKQEQAVLLQQMITREIKAVIVKVAAIGLDPHAHLGKDLGAMQTVLMHLNSLYGINVCGEGGEYETLTLDCPLFKNYRIVLDGFDIVMHSPSTIAPVGVLHPVKFHVDCKCPSLEPDLRTCVTEVEGSSEALRRGDICSVPERSLQCNLEGSEVCSFARRCGSFVAHSCWIKSSVRPYGIEKELGFVLSALEFKLEECDLGWDNVLFIHLYINDMGAFALANETYMQVITEKLCVRGVPSRSTVGLALLENGLGRVMVEVIAAEKMDKKVLHVQSISCWAPSCIGPYSQATCCHNMLYMAGQLGLDPPTMALVQGSTASQMKQALDNCKAVAQAFSASIMHCCISVLVYCSMLAGTKERQEAEVVLHEFLYPCGQGPHGKASHLSAIPVLYVQVPALPKGALVEVEPFLYTPSPYEKESTNGNLGLNRVSHGEACEGSFVPGHLCRAFFSVGEKMEVEILESEGLRYLSGEFKSCIQAFSELLAHACLNWENVLALRIMCTAKIVPYGLVLIAWESAMNETLYSSPDKHGSNSCSRTPGLEFLQPLFVPVVGSGRETTFSNLITVDVLALSSHCKDAN